LAREVVLEGRVRVDDLVEVLLALAHRLPVALRVLDGERADDVVVIHGGHCTRGLPPSPRPEVARPDVKTLTFPPRHDGGGGRAGGYERRRSSHASACWHT